MVQPKSIFRATSALLQDSRSNNEKIQYFTTYITGKFSQVCKFYKLSNSHIYVQKGGFTIGMWQVWKHFNWHLSTMEWLIQNDYVCKQSNLETVKLGETFQLVPKYYRMIKTK